MPDAAADAMLLPEVLSYLWQRGAPTKFHNMTPQSWQALLADNSRFIDLAWQDAGADYALLSRALSLPAEGDYHPDFTVLKQHRADHELYDGRIAGDLMPTFFSLYKRRLGSSFDWTTRQFQWCDQRDEGMPYTMWMSDDPQERLMMWEAAKRCRGRVLCGGLGLGVFPQLALSLPQVEAVHIIEMDQGIIDLTTGVWQRQPWPGSDRCQVIHDRIEDYLAKTNETYDTVYIDTWDAIYHEYLPHINHLANSSQRVLKDGGEILLWAYSMAED